MDIENDEHNTKQYEMRKKLKLARKGEDYNKILREYNIKCIRDNKKLSPIPLKMNIKEKIIKMAIDDPDDVFDYDFFCKAQSISKKTS